MRKRAVLAVVVTAAIAGFFAGAWWHAELSLEPPRGPAVAPIAFPRPEVDDSAARPPPVETVLRPLALPTGAADPCATTTAALQLTTRTLAALQREADQRDERRTAREGTPIRDRPAATEEPRFAPERLRSAISEAFTQTRVPGRVAGLDCTEWPCIVFGRIRGTEDEMEKLEGAKALASYERDILTVLLWVVTDEAANAAPIPGLPGRPEQSLFAFALYPRGLERPLTENVDRRVRTRTAELWNTMSPSDETGR
jgi:hypothetical protein